MKLLSILATVLLLVTTASRAQSPQHDQLQRFASSLLQAQNDAQQLNKATGITSQRLTACYHYRYYNGNSSIDSARFSYGGTRGSQFDYTYMRYLYNYTPDDAQYYPYALNRPAVMYDSSVDILYQAVNPDIIQHQALTYNSNDYVASRNFSVYYNTSFAGGGADENIFDQQGRVVLHHGFGFNGNTWDSTSKSVYYYDAQNRLVKDTVYWYQGIGVWVASVALRYSYNAAGYIDTFIRSENNGASWAEMRRYVMEYYPNNTLRSIANFYGTSGNRDSFGYAANGRVRTLSFSGWQQQHWVLYKTTTNTFTASSLPDTGYITDQLGDTMSLQIASYNSFDNPVHVVIISKDGQTLFEEQRFYYEEYTGIKETLHAVAAKLYPNPAREAVYIKPAGEYKAAMVKIYNAMGGCTGSFSFTNSEPMKIKLDGYAAGLYYYRIAYDGGAAFSDGKFIIQP
jgi:hypothetical protein